MSVEQAMYEIARLKTELAAVRRIAEDALKCAKRAESLAKKD